MSEPIIAYKGFDKNMKCRDFQYEEGETYHMPRAVLCEEGAHACTMPLDVLGYYPPGDGSIYRMVELDEVCDGRTGRGLCDWRSVGRYGVRMRWPRNGHYRLRDLRGGAREI